MPLDAEEMKEIERLLAPGSGISDEVRTQLLEARNQMQDEHLSGTLGPEQGLSLNPNFSLIPQALAVQPATTVPEGDQAAEAEWVRSGGPTATDTLLVYDVPLREAQKDLLEHPEKIHALYPDLPPGSITPEYIMAMKPGDGVLEDYQNKTWRDTAEAAVGGGKTAYRYSKAPWLHGEGANGVLDNLKLKLEGSVQPYGEGTTAFVMGVDDMANLGIGRAATETANPDMTPLNPLGSERVGGVTEPGAEEHLSQLEEEYPNLYMLGQGVGMFSEWGLANAMFGKALGVGAKAAEKLGGGLAARLGTGTVAGTVGAAGVQAGQDLVDIGANQLQGDESGPSLEDVPGRAAHTAMWASPFAALGAGVQSAAKVGAEEARWGNRYDGAIGTTERDVPDMKFSPGRGPRSKTIEDLKVKARKADVAPGDLVAQPIAAPIAKVLDEDVRGTFEQVKKAKDAYLPSGEGQLKLPTTNFMKATVDELRADMAPNKAGEGPKPGIPEPVGTPDAGGELKSFFNTQIESVSLKPVDGAVPVTPEEAQAFLVPIHQKGLRAPKPKGSPPPQTGAREIDPNDLRPPKGEEGGETSLADDLRARGIDTVYVVPRRYNAEHHETLLDKIGAISKKTNRDLTKLDQAARVDRDARPLNGEAGGWSRLQNQHSELIEKVKQAEQLVAPGGDAFKVLTTQQRQRPGEKPIVDAVRAAADRAGPGVREQLNLARSLNPYEDLIKQANWERTTRTPEKGKVAATLDWATARAFPFMRALEGPVGVGGRGGNAANLGEDKDEKARRKKQLEEKSK